MNTQPPMQVPVPFQAFLSDTHARPAVATAIGYLASITLHGPPTALFVATWLTHALLIGSSGLLPPHQLSEVVYHIPISMMTSSQALAIGGGGGTPAPAQTRKRGLPGRAGHSGRQGLVRPRHIKALPAPTQSATALASIDWPESSEHGAGMAVGSAGQGHDGLGSGQSAKGGGAAGGGVMGAAALGEGASLATVSVAKSEAVGALASAPAKAAARARARARGEPGPGEEQEEDERIVAIAGQEMKASFISQDLAAYFRTYETYPSLPESFWNPGTTEYPLTIEICVSPDGSVSNVTFMQGANEDVDRLVSSAIRSWRYRPRIVAGSPRAFCHPMRIEYSRRIRRFSQ